MSVRPRPGAGFWVISVLLLLWNGIGAWTYLMAADAEILEATPIFVTALYGIAVWAGVGAALLLLLRSRFAAPLFLLSVIAAAIRTVHMIAEGNLQNGADWVVAALIVGIGIFATWYAARAGRRGLLR